MNLSFKALKESVDIPEDDLNSFVHKGAKYAEKNLYSRVLLKY